MTPETFLEEFSTVVNAPGGVQRLREMILQLAVQGKLVPQNPEDEPVDVLLKDIIHSKSISTKKQTILSGVKAEKIPFALPDSWIWKKLGDVAEIIRGVTYSKKDAEISNRDGLIELLRANNIDGTVNFDATLFVPKELVNSIQILRQGDILIALSSGSPHLVGKAAVYSTGREATFGAFCGVIRSFSEKLFSYLTIFTKTPLYRSQTQRGGKGIGIQNLNKETLEKLLIPLPPLEEQHRIVTKVEELMALCDRLEAQQKKRTRLVGHTRKTVLEALADAQGSEELCAVWQRVEENFGMLFETPEDVEDLKKTILQNAVMGKLVEQNPEDEPALELLKRIAEEKAEMVKKGEMKKAKPLPKIRDDEKPFEIPKAWEWVRLGYLMPDYQNGISKRGSTVGMDTIVLRLADVTDNKISIANTRSIQLTEKERSQYLLDDGDILITRVNGSIDLVGSFICVRERKYPIAYCDHFIRMRLIKHLIDIDYIHMVSRSILVRRQIAGKFITTAGQKTVNQNHITTLLFPLPPLAEQHRIVAKVQSLLALCDGLQSRIAESRTIAGQLAQSIVESITGTTTEKQEKMKIPKTELVSRLVLAKKPGAREHAPLSELMARHNSELSAKALWNHSGLPIGEFYRQLKIEMINGWIKEPAKAQVKVVED